jgi:hypothetical protein
MRNAKSSGGIAILDFSGIPRHYVKVISSVTALCIPLYEEHCLSDKKNEHGSATKLGAYMPSFKPVRRLVKRPEI